MRSVLRPSSPFATLFRPRFGLVDHRIAWRGLDQRSFWPSGRFSAWFGRSSRRSQLCHNFSHRPTHLLWTGWTPTRLPGSQHGLHQWTRQHQLIVHDGDDLAPAFKLRWSAQPGLDPQQGLLLEAIAMFVGVAPPIAQGHLSHAGIRGSIPQKPTLARVAGTISGPMTQNADDRHFEVPCLGQMQAIPPGDLDGMSVDIAALPTARGLSIRAGVTTLKALPIFARRPTFARGRRRRAIQHPLAFEPQQFVERQPFRRQQKRRTTVPAITGHDGTTAKQGSELTQLGRCHLDARLLRTNALLIEHHRPTAGLLRQNHHRRELPAIADGLAALRQVRLVDHGAVWRGLRLWALDTGGIDAQPHLFPRDWLQQILRKYPAQPLLVNASIFERFIQTPPAPLEQRRERQLRKRVGLRLGQQCIHGVEQGVSRSGKTAVHVVTKVLHCAKVHLSNAPVLDLPEHYSLGQSFVKRTALLSKLV